MFAFWDNFKGELNRIYEDIDEIRIAEKKLNNLRQTESITNYAAKFQQYAARTDWNYDSQKTIYWIKFKNRVKNALILNEKLKSLIIIITKFIEINNDQYEKKLKIKNKTKLFQIETINFINRKLFFQYKWNSMQFIKIQKK